MNRSFTNVVSDAPRSLHVALIAAFVGIAASWALLTFSSQKQPSRIKALHREIGTLQEQLISAQITTRQLKSVQRLIEKNLAFSRTDTLAQGASLQFLIDLNRVFDNLGIQVLALQPKPVRDLGRFVETPYDVEITCDYGQLAQLISKMEKSPRLITVSSFSVDNSVEDFFNRDRSAPVGACPIRLQITTLTLLRKG
jgi:Tfp pilus assembly protein PilO